MSPGQGQRAPGSAFAFSPIPLLHLASSQHRSSAHTEPSTIHPFPLVLSSFPSLSKLTRRPTTYLTPRATMSNVPSSSSTSGSNLDSIFNTALRTYKKKTGKDITSHPLATELQSCDSPDAILGVLRRQIPIADQSQNSNETFEKCLIPTVNVLCTLSDTLGGVAGLVIITTSSLLRIGALTSSFQVFPPSNIIFTGIGALLMVGYLWFHCAAHFDMCFRRSKTPKQAKSHSSSFSAASNTSFVGSKFTSGCHPPPL